jgi:hypothetical protein
MDVKVSLALREDNGVGVLETKWTKEGDGKRRMDTVR